MSNRDISSSDENCTSDCPQNLLRVDNIKKSQQDSRDYRGLMLDNGLKVLLVSDKDTDVSAAALAVHVGHMSDPDELPGLAHFCEHMLFLGTEKYPHENGYTTYLSQSSGSSNAATYALMTKYHFYVAPDKLDNALDRFAQFFIAPLFTPSATDREINAVNSEHQKNLSSDSWRIKQVNRHLAKPDHAFSKFGSGNKATLCDIPKLKNIDVRNALLEFHSQWYSANIMCLCVLGKENLNELENMVLEKFEQIEDKKVALPVWPREPYHEDKYKCKVMIMSVKDLRTLHISFTTDDLTSQYKAAADSYLTHLIGHESKGSILSELRRLSWCNGLTAGHQSTLNGFGFFDINVSLTNEGVEHVDDIIHVIFQYLRLLREKGPVKWIYDEYCSMNEIRFRFKDKLDPEVLVTSAVSAMKIYPLPEVLSAPYLSKVWEPELITKLLNELVPSKCRVTLIGQSYASVCTETEPYYGTKYGIESIPDETIRRWEQCELNENLSLPEPNAFIPTNFELAPLDSDVSKHPTIIKDTPLLRVWHKQDDEFFKPKGYILVDFTNPIAYSDPLNRNLNSLVTTLLKDDLTEYLYDAELAGLKLDLSNKVSGIEMTIMGYSDKQVLLLEALLQRLFDYTCDEKRFDIIKEEYFRVLKNFRVEQPYQQSNYYLGVLMTDTVWTNEELLETKALVTYERLMRYAKDFFQRLHAECFIYGNFTKDMALDIAAMVNKRLEATDAMLLPLLARQMLRRREYKLHNGDSYLFEKLNEFHKSSCIQLYFQMGAQNDRTNIMCHLIAQILNEPCYDCLRTKEQLGYIVASGTRRINGTAGIRVIVQSTRHPTFVEDRIENFIETFMQTIEEMPLDEFERHKEALALRKLERPKSINFMFCELAPEITAAQYHFERNEAEVAILRTITKQEFTESFQKFIGRNGAERRVLSVHILSHEGAIPENEDESCVNLEEMEKRNLERHVKITDLTAFKSSKELFPLIAPVIDIRAKGARSKL